MKESILILGAGLMQKPAIESAKELGLYTFVIDANPNALCVPMADCFEPIDLKDKEKIASFALELKATKNLKAVFTAGTDFSASVAYACEKCGFKNHSYQAACNASDKTRMRSCFSKSNVPSPKFIKIERDKITETLNKKFVAGLKYPCVVKPTDNMGARGCRMIRNSKELLFSVEEAVRNSRTGTAILEEYMDGPEYSIDALVYNGTMTITGFADRHIFFPPYFIETGHTMPTDCSREKYLSLVEAFAKAVASLGLTHGAAKADIKYTAEGPMIGEIAARLSGGYMSGWTYPYASGCNLIKQAVLVATDKVPEYLESKRVPLEMESPFKLFDLPCSEVCAERAWISIPGVVKEVYWLNAKGAKDILPRAGNGDVVVFPRNNVEKCGNVIAVSKKRDDAISAAQNIVKNITIRLEPNRQETDDFLAGKKHSFENGFPPYAFQFDDEVIAMLNKELDSCKKNIPADGKAMDYVPTSLNTADILSLKDWNHLTLSETLAKFDSLAAKHNAMDYSAFWKAVIYGGIQGALYYADCVSTDSK